MDTLHEYHDHAREIVKNDADNAVASEIIGAVFRVPSFHRSYGGMQASDCTETESMSPVRLPTMRALRRFLVL